MQFYLLPIEPKRLHQCAVLYTPQYAPPLRMRPSFTPIQSNIHATSFCLDIYIVSGVLWKRQMLQH
jgi:hypothetical protein